MRKEIVEYLEGMIEDREEMIKCVNERLNDRILKARLHTGDAKEYYEDGARKEEELLNILKNQIEGFKTLLEKRKSEMTFFFCTKNKRKLCKWKTY